MKNKLKFTPLCLVALLTTMTSCGALTYDDYLSQVKGKVVTDLYGETNEGSEAELVTKEAKSFYKKISSAAVKSDDGTKTRAFYAVDYNEDNGYKITTGTDLYADGKIISTNVLTDEIYFITKDSSTEKRTLTHYYFDKDSGVGEIDNNKEIHYVKDRSEEYIITDETPLTTEDYPLYTEYLTETNENKETFYSEILKHGDINDIAEEKLYSFEKELYVSSVGFKVKNLVYKTELTDEENKSSFVNVYLGSFEKLDFDSLKNSKLLYIKEAFIGEDSFGIQTNSMKLEYNVRAYRETAEKISEPKFFTEATPEVDPEPEIPEVVE